MSSTGPFDNIKLIAYYLPQYYPFSENNEWWGKGFTEWTNVTKARPLFADHYQPHLPTELGFYDLRMRETRLEQISLAKEYGINGFCYHYYWFAGKRLLDKPVADMLSDPASDMPFCLCWANENWTRAWDAKEHEVLIKQDYDNQDDDKFVDDLIPFFLDPRYIRIDNAVVLIVYRPQQIPNLPMRVKHWKERCKKQGVELHLCAALTHGNESYTEFGFDSGVEFPPHNPKIRSAAERLTFSSEFYGTVLDFGKVAESYLQRKYMDPNVFKCVFPSWDNTARRNENALVVVDGTPENFELWLRKTCELTASQYPQKERFVFINAWNEWAEGCHLEPDRRYGRRYLEAVTRVKEGLSNVSEFSYSGSHPDNNEIGPTKSWERKVRRELKRVGRQIVERKLRVAVSHGEVRSDPRYAQSHSKLSNPSASAAPDLKNFMSYDYEIDLTGDSAGAFVVELAGSGKTILEIGAGSGSITKHLCKNANEVVGIEINPVSVEKLKAYTSEVHNIDLNVDGWTSRLGSKRKFDLVIAADVLEHLYDPWTVLKGMKQLLADDGCIITSLPHIAHCTVIACLLQEDFEYREWGLLDKTHIRFFGIHNIQSLYESAGLEIVDARFVMRPPEKTEFADRWERLPRDIRDALLRGRHAHVYQIVTKAVRKERAGAPVRLHDLPLPGARDS